jgi:selenocysteine lyase/cysteine desulfurase
METDRRTFFMQLGAGMAALAHADLWEELAAQTARTARESAEAVATDEDYWAPIQRAYLRSPYVTNLNNGGVSPQPIVVQEAFERFNRFSNEAPAYTMWQILDKGREKIRDGLAELGGCSPEEVAVVRNTTEALAIVVFGLELKAGDEVVLTKQDYPNMIHDWKLREKRDGVKLVWLDLEMPFENPNYAVEKFAAAFGPRTKAVQITQMINWTGQIMPVRQIADLARSRGIATICDGAHTFAQYPFKIPDLGCDYFGTSLHKWLSAPFGTGMLYVKKEKIGGLWPLFPNQLFDTDDVRKFEWMGTRSIPTEAGIATALEFHRAVGSERKAARLRYLKNYWAQKAAQIPGVKIHTSFKDEFSGALALFSVEGKKPSEVERHLMDKHRIYVVAIEWENISGVRVTPHIYTTLDDLDRLVKGIAEIAEKK